MRFKITYARTDCYKTVLFLSLKKIMCAPQSVIVPPPQSVIASYGPVFIQSHYKVLSLLSVFVCFNSNNSVT